MDWSNQHITNNNSATTIQAFFPSVEESSSEVIVLTDRWGHQDMHWSGGQLVFSPSPDQ